MLCRAQGVALPARTAGAAGAGAVASWRELHVDTDGQELEENWLRLQGEGQGGEGLGAGEGGLAGSQEAIDLAAGTLLCRHGNAFVFVRDLADRARAAEDLAGFGSVAEALDSAALPLGRKRALLDCEFSFGSCNASADSADWTVEMSTCPGREGQPLFPAAN